MAKFVRGFSKTVWSGINPKAPNEAKSKMNGINKIPNRNDIQNQRFGFEKSVFDVVFFLAIINYLLFQVFYAKPHVQNTL